MIKVLVEYDGEGRKECPSYFYTNNVPRIGELISFPVRDTERDLNWTTFKVKGIDYLINNENLCREVELFVEIER
jgi:hypothetical protein